MKQDALVSVIIPVYNVRPYLAEALDSAIHQTYENLEIILIDDGSTDSSDQICDKYAAKDARITVIHQENRGLSAARNAGLEIMTGEIVAFLDADDAWHPEFVSAMAAAMDRSDADMVICKRSTQYTTGRLCFNNTESISPPAREGVYDRVSALRAYAYGKINSGVWNKLYKRELWEKERFPEGHVYEDVDIAHRILDRCQRICVLSDVLYLYRRRPGSITDLPTRESLSDLFLAYAHFDAFAKKHVPEVFPAEITTLLKQRRMNQKITYYAALSRTKDPALREYIEELRRQVIDSGRKGAIREYKLLTQVSYRILCLCPWVLGAAAPVFNQARSIGKRVTEDKKKLRFNFTESILW